MQCFQLFFDRPDGDDELFFDDDIMMVMMNYFCGDVVDRRKAYSRISSWGYCKILTIVNVPHAASRVWTCVDNDSGLANWSCAIVVTTTLRRHDI